MAALAAVVLPWCATGQSQDFKVGRHLKIGGTGGWDYIAQHPQTRDLYVSHGTQVNIISSATGDSVGCIPNTTGVHGIAFVAEQGKGYTSNGQLNTVAVFDMRTNAVKGQVKTGENPDAIMYDAFSHLLYVCNGRSKDMSIIDPVHDSVVAVVPLGGKPETAVSDNKGHIYVNVEDKNEIVVWNTQSRTITNRWPTGHGEEPAGLAIDRAGKRLFAGCSKLLVVMSTDDGKVIAELPIGDGCDGVGYDEGLHLAFCSNGSGTLSVAGMRSGTYSILATVPTQRGARTLVVDDVLHKIYLPVAAYGALPPNSERRRPPIVPGTFEVLEVSRQ